MRERERGREKGWRKGREGRGEGRGREGVKVITIPKNELGRVLSIPLARKHQEGGRESEGGRKGDHKAPKM